MLEKKFRKSLELEVKRFYLCPPKPKGVGDLKSWIMTCFWREKNERNFFSKSLPE
jgi:hypothetical protein